MSVISNTTVLSNFASIGQLELLRRLYHVLYIPTEVYEEISAGLEEGYSFYRDALDVIHPFKQASLSNQRYHSLPQTAVTAIVISAIVTIQTAGEHHA